MGDGENFPVAPGALARDAKSLPVFDHSEHNVEVFDEIFMNGLHMLNKIREFVNENPNKIIIGAGDTNSYCL